MSAGVTDRSHYNPCFWTALWNERYYKTFVAAEESTLRARKQSVFCLSIHSGRIYESSVERVYYSKGESVADLTPEYMRAFAARYFPAKYGEVSRYVARDPSVLLVDFEDILRGIEQKDVYKCILDAAREKRIQSVEQKAFITVALVLHMTRSHAFISTLLREAESMGLGRMDAFWNLKNAWGDPAFLIRAAHVLAGGKWVVYCTSENAFPFCDSPVMVERDRLTAILSPRMLVRIDLNIASPEDQWETVHIISGNRLRQLRQIAIENTYTAIISSTRNELEHWRTCTPFLVRKMHLNRAGGNQDSIAEGAMRIRWALNGFGRLGDDFDAWAKTQLEKLG